MERDWTELEEAFFRPEATLSLADTLLLYRLGGRASVRTSAAKPETILGKGGSAVRDQSRWMGVGLIAVGLLVALGCWHFNHGGSRADAAAGSAISVSATQDDSLLQKLGIKLENPGVENKAPLNLVPQGRAVQNAKWAYPKVAKTASSISCVYRLISKPDFSSFSPEALAANPVLRETHKLMRTPVYVVSFVSGAASGGSGIDPAASGNSGAGGLETNVVVDAMTGVTLLSFSY